MTTTKRTTRRARRTVTRTKTSLFVGFHLDNPADVARLDALCRTMSRNRSDVCRRALNALMANFGI